MRYVILGVISVSFLASGVIAACSTLFNSRVNNTNTMEEKLASQLKEAGYSGLFQYGERSMADSLWKDGSNKNALLQIVLHPEYENYIRLLASELLYAKDTDYPPADWKDTLAFIYSQALVISGKQEGVMLSGNQWGFMYYTDQEGVNDYGILGSHLIKTDLQAVPYLVALLDNRDTLFYEGSEEATVGNNLKYRVKDAAAYYIGKIADISVQFHQDYAERDAEIERLKQKIK